MPQSDLLTPYEKRCVADALKLVLCGDGKARTALIMLGDMSKSRPMKQICNFAFGLETGQIQQLLDKLSQEDEPASLEAGDLKSSWTSRIRDALVGKDSVAEVDVAKVDEELKNVAIELKKVQENFDTARKMCEQQELCIKNLKHEKEKMQKVHENDKKALIEELCKAKETDTEALIGEVELQKKKAEEFKHMKIELEKVQANFDIARKMCERQGLCIEDLERDKEKMQKVHENDKKALIEELCKAKETDTQALVAEVELQKQNVRNLTALLAAKE
jgi:hypothetical protein